MNGKLSIKLLLLFGSILIIGALAHGFNMFNFPYYENDEGVYMSQAWSLITQGEMAPYTYWYDHAPGGWILIAIWTLLTGGFYTFGFSLNTGRVFMLILHVASTLLVMLITQKVTKNKWIGALAGLFFSLTPIGLYFHRRVLLDNIMVFWVLLSYYFLVKNRLKLHEVLVSGLIFGFAVLTKENAIFFVPGFLVTIYLLAHRYHKHLAVIKWLIVSGLVISLYFLYALLKGELFPSGTLLGGEHEHVSLIETLQFQSSRDGGSVFDSHSSIWRNIFLWIQQDPFIMLLGALANVVVFVLSIIKKKSLYFGVALLGLFFWLFLTRGGIVIEFYVIPLLPILSILLAIMINEIIKFISIKVSSWLTTVIYFGAVVSVGLGYLLFMQTDISFGNNSTYYFLFKSKQTAAQHMAVSWLREHVDKDKTIIIDNHSYIDLQDPNNPTNKLFPDAEWYWKVDKDIEVREGVLNGNPENIDLIVSTPQMDGDLQSGTSPLTTEALNNSKIWKSFAVDGWSVQLWRPYYPRNILERSWEDYKEHFIFDGQVIDLQQVVTTSEGQSYALLRAVWMDDDEAFKEVLAWTNKYLRRDDNLFSWQYGRNDEAESVVLDESSAPDADQDIALALLFAYKRWGNEAYLEQAKQIIKAIWDHEIKEMNGEYYLLAGPWAQNKNGIVTNPSYMSPYIYRIFNEVDNEHDWNSVIDTSYKVLELCSSSTLSEINAKFLPPEWCLITPNEIATPVNEEGLTATEYSYNAFRIPWKMAVDYKWNHEERALEYLRKLDFLEREWQEHKELKAAYTHSGEIWENYESIAAYGTNLGLFEVINASAAAVMYRDKIKAKFYEDETRSYWDDPKNYYTQNWAWFGTALYDDRLLNLWEEM